MVEMFMAAAVASAAAGTTLFSTKFDAPEDVKLVRADANWKYEDGVGVGGSRALVWTNDDRSNYNVKSILIKGVTEGMKLRGTFKVKADSLKGAKLGCTICWNDDDGWLGGAGGTTVKWGDRRLKPDRDGWYDMEIVTPYITGKAKKVYLQLYVHRGGTGRVLFDDVRVEVLGLKTFPGVRNVVTSGYRSQAADGDLRVAALVDVPCAYWEKGTLKASLSYVSADGARRSMDMNIVDSDLAEASLSVSSLAMGRQKIVVTVDGVDGRKFGTCETDFERVERLAARRVTFDRLNRTLVDGKKFFPLGMYWSEDTLARTNSLERYVQGPFNCLQTYEKSMTPEILDRYWKYGLRVVASVKDVYVPADDGRRLGFTPVGVKTRTDETNYVKRVVERCRNHPALLAWYTCDEIPEPYRDRLRDRYQLMKELDPEHPTFVCIASPQDSRSFMDCTDAVGSDPYPVPGYDSRGVTFPPDFGRVWGAGKSAAAVKAGMLGFRAQWQVPQAFAWKWDYKDRPDQRFPTFKELRSMVWQQIAVGANGILLYSYGQMIRRPGFDDNFRVSCKVAADVKAFIPVLLLDPGPDVASKPERTIVRTWRDGARAYVLVCNTYPERRTGTLTVGGVWKSCEILFGNGVALKDGAFALDMEPMGVSIVRVE